MTDANKELAQRLAESNEQLKISNLDLTTRLDTATAELTKVKGINESLIAEKNNISESFDATKLQISESLGVDITTQDGVLMISESLSELKTLKSVLADFNESYGTLDEASHAIDEALESSNKIKKILDDAGVSADELSAFVSEYGSVPEVKQAFHKVGETLGKIAEDKTEADLTALSAKFGKSMDDIKSAMSKFKLTTAAELEDFYMTAGITPVKAKGDDEIHESYTPGSALDAVVTGSSFRRAIDSVDVNANAQRRQKANDISESHNSPERLKRILG